MTDEEMAEEYYYKNYPVTLNIGEEARKMAIINVFLAALKKGSQLDKVWLDYDSGEYLHEGKWVNRNSELEKKYDACLRENATLKMHNAIIEKNLLEAKEIIQRMLRDIPNRMWYTDETIKQAEQFLKEDSEEKKMDKEKLEKEAGDYAEKHAFRVPYDGSNKFYNDTDYKASKEGYIAGAEPREKIIAKLEKLNKNQEESLRITLLEEERKAKRIKELEVENAEIKAKYLQATDEGTSWAHLKNLEDENKKLLQSCEGATMMYKDLCKAREIIKSLLTYCRNYPQQALEKIQQAEQFLKEEEIKENTKAPTPEEIKNRLSNIGEAIGDIALDYIINLEKENTELSEKLNEQKQYTQFKCSEAVNTIEKLKTLIRKMKRCQNCDKFDYTECKCKVGWCNNFEKWALKEVVFVDLKELDDDSE